MAESASLFQVKFLRGTQEANDVYIGPVGEMTIDMTKWHIRIHDGQTPGGNVVSNMNDLQAVIARLDGLSMDDIIGVSEYQTKTEIASNLNTAISQLETQLRSEISAASGGAEQDFEVRQLTVNNHILPATTNLDIGSTTQRFRSIYVDEAHLSTNTLYIGDTPIMGTDQDAIMIKADPDQSITMRTSGTGITNIQSEKGATLTTTGTNADVEMVAGGAGSQIRMTAADDVNIIGGNGISLQGDVVLTDNLQVTKDVTVTGNLTVNGTRTEVNTDQVNVSDNMLNVNHGEVGSGVTAGTAGIEIDRGNLSSYQFVFDESVGLFRVGMVGDLETVATRPWGEATFSKLDHVHTAASTTVSGFMSAEDKTKLNSVDVGAEKNVAPTKIAIDALNVDAATVNGLSVNTAVPVNAVFTDTVYDDSAVTGELATKVDKVTGKTLSTNDYTDVEKSKLAGVEAGAEVNAVTTVAGKTGAVTVTKADVGLGSVDNTADSAKPVSTAQQTALDTKVAISDIVDGLLSTATNVPLSANQGRVLKGHIDNINTLLDSDTAALDTLQEVVDYVEANRSSLESLGISNIAGLQTALNNKVDKVTGKALSTNDYSDAEKAKLGAIESGAQVNVGTNLGSSRNATSYTVSSSTGSDTTLAEATTTSAGVLSSSDKSKLNGIESGAQANVGDTFNASGVYTGLRAQATTKADVGLSDIPNSTTASRTSTSTISLLQAKAMNDHRDSADHDARYYTRSQVDAATDPETLLAPMGFAKDASGNWSLDAGTLQNASIVN